MKKDSELKDHRTGYFWYTHFIYGHIPHDIRYKFYLVNLKHETYVESM